MPDMDMSFLESLLGKGAGAGAAGGAGFEQSAGQVMPASQLGDIFSKKSLTAGTEKPVDYKAMLSAGANSMNQAASSDAPGAGPVVTPSTPGALPEDAIKQQALQDLINQYTAKPKGV